MYTHIKINTYYYTYHYGCMHRSNWVPYNKPITDNPIKRFVSYYIYLGLTHHCVIVIYCDLFYSEYIDRYIHFESPSRHILHYLSTNSVYRTLQVQIVALQFHDFSCNIFYYKAITKYAKKEKLELIENIEKVISKKTNQIAVWNGRKLC